MRLCLTPQTTQRRKLGVGSRALEEKGRQALHLNRGLSVQVGRCVLWPGAHVGGWVKSGEFQTPSACPHVPRKQILRATPRDQNCHESSGLMGADHLVLTIVYEFTP